MRKVVVVEGDRRFAYAAENATEEFIRRVNEFMGTSFKTLDDIITKKGKVNAGAFRGICGSAMSGQSGSWWFVDEGDGPHACLTNGGKTLELFIVEEDELERR